MLDEIWLKWKLGGEKQKTLISDKAQHKRYKDRKESERAIIQFVRKGLLWRGQIADITVPLSHDSKVIDSRPAPVAPSVANAWNKVLDEVRAISEDTRQQANLLATVDAFGDARAVEAQKGGNG